MGLDKGGSRGVSFHLFLLDPSGGQDEQKIKAPCSPAPPEAHIRGEIRVLVGELGDSSLRLPLRLEGMFGH
jgi:hypothetical protein